MKTNNIFRLLTLAMAAIAFAFVTSCEGPQGPAGPAGAVGPTGPEGPAGENAQLSCLECHGIENMENITFQFSASQHKAGDVAVNYAGGRGSCAECHSHEGFLEWAATGDVAANIENPQAWECQTCHNIHTTFEATDYAFRAGEDVTLVSGNVIAGGNNNTCLNCHKSRRDIGAYDKYTEATKDTIYFKNADDIAFYEDPAHVAYGPTGGVIGKVTGLINPVTGETYDSLAVEFDIPLTNAFISSTHAGPHHGPQGDVWAGENGSTAGEMYSPHSGGCVTCHMGPASGHSFQPKEGNCTECHTSKKTEMDAIAARILAVGEKLEDIHAVHATRDFSGNVLEWHPIYASLTKEQFNAWWDFMVVLEDRSDGAHNPTYVKALLTSIEAALP